MATVILEDSCEISGRVPENVKENARERLEECQRLWKIILKDVLENCRPEARALSEAF